MSTANLHRRLVELDAAILEQKLVLDDLQRDKTAVQDELYAISTFPVSTGLPVETTTEIFTRCLPTIDELGQDSEEFIHMLVPIVLLGVCRAWRDIALATPALWATVAIRSKDVGVEAFVDRWLGRAAPRPLSMICHADTLPPSRLRDIIHRYADRMEYLEVRCKPSKIPELKLDTAKFPLLRRATIGVPEYHSESMNANAVKVFANAPQLRAVVLVNGSWFSRCVLPWLQLTKFEGEIDTLDIFRMAPNLVEVKCAMGYLPGTDVITHPCLQSLTVTISSEGNPPADLLDRFHLPALRSLHISDTTRPIHMYSLAGFFQRSAPPLRTLSVNVYGCAYLRFDDCLSIIGDTLHNLEVAWPSTDFVDAILGGYYHPLPRLQSLALIHSTGVKYMDLVHFLRERTLSTPGSPSLFRSFRLGCPHGTFPNDEFISASEPCAEDIADLAAFVDGGLDLCIPSETRLVHHSW